MFICKMMSIIYKCVIKVSLIDVFEKILKIVFRLKYFYLKISSNILVWIKFRIFNFLDYFVWLEIGWNEFDLCWFRKSLFYLEYFKINILDFCGCFRIVINWRESNGVRNFLNFLLIFKFWWVLGGKYLDFFVLIYDSCIVVFW